MNKLLLEALEGEQNVLTMDDWKEVAKEAARCASDQCETIIFLDGTVSAVTGSGSPNKPVLLILGPGRYTAEDIWIQMEKRIRHMQEMEKIKRKFWSQFK
ncbi:hypothetical protein H2C83_01915 [Thermoactinomyces sp. AMNI-1]|uniref:Uncharacterized protein n=1 Tax=Thermoactinomyces mirandus TaxID=2756294 RepID=A0A7W2AQ45_9BACL|nr:hypothetical protein [Thermoactinomyces mirandus]